MLLRLLNLRALPVPLIALLLAAALPTASAAEDADTDTEASGAKAIDTVGFWIGFTLIFVVSAVEAAASIIWIRRRITWDESHPCELSEFVCGRQVSVGVIDLQEAQNAIAEGSTFAGYYQSRGGSSVVVNGATVFSQPGSGFGVNPFCGGVSVLRPNRSGGPVLAVDDKFGSLVQVPTLLLRRFNPFTSLEAPAGLVDNIKNLLWPGERESDLRWLEHVVHFVAGLVDISLGVAGLVLNPGSVQGLIDTIKDPEAPISFENYLTLFLLYWLLGVLLLLCMIPLRGQMKSLFIFGWPKMVEVGIAVLTSLVLFILGCWKIDYARRQGAPWTPMLSYWVGGASSIHLTFFDISVFCVFGVVGLGFMLKHVFG